MSAKPPIPPDVEPPTVEMVAKPWWKSGIVWTCIGIWLASFADGLDKLVLEHRVSVSSVVSLVLSTAGLFFRTRMADIFNTPGDRGKA